MAFRQFFAACILTIAPTVTACAGWEAVEGEALKSLVSNTTWEGAGFVVYWNADGTRRLKTDRVDLTENWEIVEGGTVLCAGKGSDQGERCGVVEIKEHKKKEKTKYRSTRVRPNKGKRFDFKVKDGIAQ